MAQDRPIFVVGYQRSGTTLLQALLGAHRRIAGPPETHFIFRIARLADWYGDLSDDGNLRRALHDTLNPVVPVFAASGFDEDVLYERARTTDRSYRALLEVVMSDFAQRHGKPRWCEKTPSQRAGGIFRHFPEAQVVHIVRDPRNVVASSLETPWVRGGAGAVSREWRAFTLANIREGLRVGPSHFLQIRYEDLTREPEAVLRVVCAFLEEQYDPGMLTAPARRRPTIADVAAPWQRRALGAVEPGRDDWRDRLSLLDRARVAAEVHRELPALGYPVPSRRTIAVGRVLNAPAALERPQRWLRRKIRRGDGRDPEWRYQQVQRFLTETGAHVANAE